MKDQSIKFVLLINLKNTNYFKFNLAKQTDHESIVGIFIFISRDNFMLC